MAKYFYFDRTDQKQGPIDEQQLRELAAAGIIKPNTPMETVEGHEGIAKQIPGLRFTTSATSSSTVPEWYATVAIICGIGCIVLSLVALGVAQYARHLLTQGYDSRVVFFRLLFFVNMLRDIVFVAGMFFGCRGISTNKTRIAQIGVLLCIIAFFIPRLLWTLQQFGMMN